MQRILTVFLILLFSSALGTAVASTPNQTAPFSASYQLVRSEFGIFNLPDSGKPIFVPTRRVPYQEQQKFGWIIQIKSDKARIKWREEFVLPSKPESWGVPETVGTRTISNDGTTSVIEREVSNDQGLLYNAWEIAPGDPKGRHVIKVFIEGNLAARFEFEIQ